ncbi:PadR family transcriptional regulator [Microbacterium sp. NPDC055683]
MIEVMVLGFLSEGPLHGYELRRRMEQLHGYARRISDGALYPAITRLVSAGLIVRRAEEGSGGASRQMLTLTAQGRSELEHRLRETSGHDITDGDRFFVVLAFLSQLPDRADRDAVLRRRLDFLASPRPFFDADGGDPYRAGIRELARAYNRAQREWIGTMIDRNEDNR